VSAPARAFRAGGRRLELGGPPLLMGIVNATLDSFSDGGDLPDAAARVARAHELVAAGARIVDVGGESAFGGRPPVPAAEEIARVVPVIERLGRELDALISVDTYKPEVAEAAIAAGAHIVNDVSGLRDPELAEICAGTGAGLILMHTRVAPKRTLLDPGRYDDVVADVRGFLEERIAIAEAAGMHPEQLLLDPGPDFAKTPAQTVEVLRELDRVRALGRPLLLALSRKDFIGAVTRRPPRDRLAGTLAAVGHVLGHPGTILRVHDVGLVADYVAVADVLAGRTDLPVETRLPVALRRQDPDAV
jgi:dihydropteroate synthase